MSKMIQIRGVPDEVHTVLKARAAREGMSLSDYIKNLLQRNVELPTMQEWLDRVRRNPPLQSDKSSAEIIRELRDGR